MDASCKIQGSIHVFRLVYKYVSRILGTYHLAGGFLHTKRKPLNRAALKSRDDRIRTCGLLVPNEALYQAEPHPVNIIAIKFTAIIF